MLKVASRGLVIALVGLAVTACHPSQELALSHIPPVLTADFVLDSADPQLREFSFDASGQYELKYRTDLRHGPGSSPDSHVLSGTILIKDASGDVRLREDFDEKLGPNQIGGTLLSFHSRAVAGENPHTDVARGRVGDDDREVSVCVRRTGGENDCAAEIVDFDVRLANGRRCGSGEAALVVEAVGVLEAAARRPVCGGRAGE